MDILSEFYEDHKRVIVGIGIVMAALIIIYIIFLIVYNPIKIELGGKGSEVVATQMTQLDFTALASDKKQSGYDIKWEVSAGTLTNETGGATTWELPDQIGTYTITAISGNVKQSKNVTVLKNIALATLENAQDTTDDADSDGLITKYEEETSLTDPQKADSDEDGLDDRNEIVLGLNPLKADSKEDGMKDGERTVSYELENKEAGIRMTLKGTGNIINTTVDQYQTTSLSQIKNIVSPVYYINTAGKTDSLQVTFSNVKALADQKGVNENTLSVYRFNEESQKFEKLDSKVNTELHTVSADVKRSGKYFIASTEGMVDSIATQLMFVIDNSGSMYGKEQVADSEENDVDFKRVTNTSHMIEELKGDYQFGVGKFTFSYTNLSDLSANKEAVIKKVNTIMTEPENFSGTNIGEALAGGLEQFEKTSKANARKYIVLITDGKDTAEVEGYDEEKLVEATQKAKQLGVKVYTIGLGQTIDETVLKTIAMQTSGSYFYAESDIALDAIYAEIAAALNFNLVTVDNKEQIILEDSGFNAMNHGFSFDNIPLKSDTLGTMYGMSLFSKLYFEKKLPTSMKSTSVTNPSDNTVIKAEGYSGVPLKENESLSAYQMANLSFLSTKPYDFYNPGATKNVLGMNKEYLTALQEAGFTIYNQKYNQNKAGFSSYQNYAIDTDVSEETQEQKAVPDDIYHSILRLDILTYRDTKISFLEKPKEAFQHIRDELNKKRPVLLKLNDNYTVVVGRLLQDNTDANSFRYEIYDPNVAGKSSYIEIKRVPKYPTQDNLENVEYLFFYQGKNVTATISEPNIQEYL